MRGFGWERGGSWETPEPLSHRIPSPVMSWEAFDSTLGRQKAEARQYAGRDSTTGVENILPSSR